MPHISTYKELRVYQAALDAAVRIFELRKSFPHEERYAMTDQIRRASRSVFANLGEAWRRRRYKRHFVSKINECESEAEETRVWGIVLAMWLHIARTGFGFGPGLRSNYRTTSSNGGQCSVVGHSTF